MASSYAEGVWWVKITVVGVAVLLLLASPLRADSTYPLNNDPAVKQALDHFYNLDFEGAEQRFETILQAHPQDPMANAYLMTVIAFHQMYAQDLLDTTYYAHEGFLRGGRKVVIPEAARRRIEDLTNGAIDLADKRIKANENDKDAWFARSYAKGIHAAFMILADHSFAGAARQGLSSRSDAEKVLALDPSYTDAKMPAGIQQYAVASLPRWMRFMVGAVGVGGNKEKGFAMLRECQQHGTLTRVQAMTAMMLFLRHDRRYGDAIEVAKQLAGMYPRDYLYRLEVANLTKDAGHGPEAIAEYKKVLADAGHKGYFYDARLQLALFGLAETERGQGLVQEAAEHYLEAARQPNCSDWMKKRADLNAGMMLDKLNRRAEAVEQYKLAVATGGDQSQADAARGYLKQPYKGN